ncbi:MAG TPA: hypothetical protein VFB12_12945 [Ktedonobacteraceae bacterium]|nr:hypothetical protein [Ktedonobacteraceae bacterium]
MQLTVTPKQRQAARRELIRQIEQGASAREARIRSAVPMHRTTVYRLLKRVQREGESAFVDGRHGHPVKLRGEMLTFLIESCQDTPNVSSSATQRAIEERFSHAPSVSQLNRVRASLGLTRKPVPREKKPKSVSIEPGYSEGAGGLLLLAAATETGLLTQLENALPTEVTPVRPPLVGSSVVVRQRLLLTLLFLGAVGLYGVSGKFASCRTEGGHGVTDGSVPRSDLFYGCGSFRALTCGCGGACRPRDGSGTHCLPPS